MIEEQITFYKCSHCRKPYEHRDEALLCEKRHREEYERDHIKSFELKQEHLALLKQTVIRWNDCEFGAPEVDPKRPYGNSDCEDDIAEIIKFKKPGNWDYDEEMWKDQASDALNKFHRETEIALQIVLHCQTFKPGKYRKKDDYGQDWEFVGDSQAVKS